MYLAGSVFENLFQNATGSVPLFVCQVIQNHNGQLLLSNGDCGGAAVMTFQQDIFIKIHQENLGNISNSRRFMI